MSAETTGPKGRNGAARRSPKTTATTTAATDGRRPRTTTRRPRATGGDAASGTTRPAAPVDPVGEMLKVALTAITDETIRRRIAQYRSQRFTADEWAHVATLIRLGIAAATPSSEDLVNKFGWILSLHARVHLDTGSSRTVTGWYSHDAIETTLRSTHPEVSGRSLGGYAARLRLAGTRLVPPPTPTPVKYTAYDPHGPYATGELEQFLDFAHDHPRRDVGTRLTRLLWVGLGTGAFDRELGPLTGHSFTRTEHAVLADLSGDGRHVPARLVPVFGACEAPLLAIAEEVGDQTLWTNITRTAGIASRVVHTAKLPDSLPRLTMGRLRATWLALVIGSGAPLTALLPAAGVSGERTFGHLVAKVAPVDPVTYARTLRASTAPLPEPGVRLPAGHRHPSPVVPLREVDQEAGQ